MKLLLPARSASAHSGFTLIELLVTIGIVSLLAALLFPALKNAINAGNTAKCSNNLRQIGMAIHQYAQDNDGWIVPSSTSNGTLWWATLAPYLGAQGVGTPLPGNPMTSVYMCPVTKRNHDGTGITEYRPPGYVTRYNINYHIAEFAPNIANGGVWSVFRKTKMSQIEQPSKTFIVGDLFGNGGGAYWMATDGELTYPHQEKVNMLFLDNHVEAIGRERMNYLGQNPFHVFWKGYDWGYPGYKTD